MKAKINIEYSKENWSKVHTILGLLETESINYDADFGSHRTVKGEPPLNPAQPTHYYRQTKQLVIK